MNQMRRAFAVVRGWTGRGAMALSLGLVVAGFGAVFFGWLEASGTADVRIQMQDLISGGVGGIALVVVGATLTYVTVADRIAARSEHLLTRLAERLDPQTLGTVAGDRLVATAASIHREGCDLLDGGVDTVPVTRRDVRRRGLSACRVCRPETAA
jgi:hypothetical protein